MKYVVLVAAVLGSAVACSPNLYGYARYYEPLGEESDLFAASIDPPYIDVQRDPAEFDGDLLGWFGVVTEVEPQPDGTALVRMSQRSHIERHLCETRSDDSCRVTVSERDAGPFSIRVRLRPGADTEGVNRVQRESLIKVYGRVSGDYDVTGGPFLSVEYYRHWPRGQYLDTTAQAYMRR